jgi:nicotinate phosphoribosyltransferase
MPIVGGVDAALFTDLYELTMAACHVALGRPQRATFELSVRALPPERNFLVAAGIAEALDFLEQLSFGDDALAFLRSLEIFDDDFLHVLAGLQFSGDVRAVDDGEVVFAGEPLLEVSAPYVEAQIVETFLLNCVASRTMVASKAARVALACDGRAFFDFSARRDHGIDAAMGAAKASAIAGASGTSLVEAGRRYGVSLAGTMAHSHVMAFDDEREAFRAYARTFPSRAILLIDTYDTIGGAHHVVEVAAELAADGIAIRGVRLDSGDIAALAVQVREILDQGGCRDTEIVASGDLDEHTIARLLAAGAPIDSFGVGTRMGTSDDAPSLGAVYKLVEMGGEPVMKLAPGKDTMPGRKQVWRQTDGDLLALAGERAEGRPLLSVAHEAGRRLRAVEPVDAARARSEAALAAMPERLRSLAPADPPYPVRRSPALAELRDSLVRRGR